MKPSTALSLVALVVLTLAGVGYLTVGVLDMDPRRTTHHVTVRMDTSGLISSSRPVTATA